MLPGGRRLVVAPVVALALVLTACGGSGGSGSATSASGSTSTTRRGAFGALQSAKVQACLKQQGVTVPTRPSGGTRPYGGQGGPPAGAGGQPYGGGQPPTGNGAGRRGGGFGFGAGNAKLRAALKACGVTLPQGGGAAGDGTSTTPTTPATPAATTNS